MDSKRAMDERATLTAVREVERETGRWGSRLTARDLAEIERRKRALLAGWGAAVLSAGAL